MPYSLGRSEQLQQLKTWYARGSMVSRSHSDGLLVESDTRDAGIRGSTSVRPFDGYLRNVKKLAAGNEELHS